MKNIKFRFWKRKTHADFTILDLMENIHRFDMSDLIVEQYPGIKDKNGQEICQGDIVKYNDDSGTEQKGVVEYRPGIYMCIAIGGDDEGDQDCPLGDRERECEVIANIHENPEMLEEK